MKTKKLSLNQRRAIVGLLFISPWLAGFLFFYVRSLFLTIQFSLSRVELLEVGGYNPVFIGLDNFKTALFEDATFNQILVSSLQNMIFDVPAIIFFSLFMAILLNQKFHGRTVVRAIFFLPVIFNSGAISDSLEKAVQLMQGGAGSHIIDAAAGSGGIDVQYFMEMFMDLGIPDGIIEFITGLVGRIYELIRASGVQIIIFLAALQSVSGSLYEVAKIEGATAYETFWRVTFPMVTPLILTNVVYTIVDSFTNSEVVRVAYEASFQEGQINYGLGSAMNLLNTGSVCIVLIIVVALISRKTFYHN